MIFSCGYYWVHYSWVWIPSRGCQIGHWDVIPVSAFYQQALQLGQFILLGIDQDITSTWEVKPGCSLHSISKVLWGLLEILGSCWPCCLSKMDNSTWTTTWLWAMLQVHHEVKVMYGHNFYGHPAVATVITLHVFKTRVMNTAFDKFADAVKSIDKNYLTLRRTSTSFMALSLNWRRKFDGGRGCIFVSYAILVRTSSWTHSSNTLVGQATCPSSRNLIRLVSLVKLRGSIMLDMEWLQGSYLFANQGSILL